MLTGTKQHISEWPFVHKKMSSEREKQGKSAYGVKCSKKQEEYNPGCYMYMVLDCSPQVAFPSRSIWNPVIPPRMGFFAWEASRGKMLTLNQLKRRGRPLANRCFLCEEDEEEINHLLLHCKKARML